MDNKVGGRSDWETKFKRKCTGIIVSAETKKHDEWIICEAGLSGLGDFFFSLFFCCYGGEKGKNFSDGKVLPPASFIPSRAVL